MSSIWTDGVRCGVSLTFDLDAELMWLSRDESSVDDPVLLSEGTYGVTTGLPRILQMLDELDVRATFFVPGKIIEDHKKQVQKITAAGHEIGYHSYRHEPAVSVEQERQSIRRCTALMQQHLDTSPVGFRAPEFRVIPGMLEMAVEEGFTYSSNFMDRDRPYLHRLNADQSLVELPVDWMFDDSSHFFFTLQEPSRRPIAAPSQVFEMWRTEFDGIYDEGGSMVLTIHPQISGRISRVRMLGQLIRHMQMRPKTMIAPAAELASAVRSGVS